MLFGLFVMAILLSSTAGLLPSGVASPIKSTWSNLGESWYGSACLLLVAVFVYLRTPSPLKTTHRPWRKNCHQQVKKFTGTLKLKKIESFMSCLTHRGLWHTCGVKTQVGLCYKHILRITYIVFWHFLVPMNFLATTNNIYRPFLHWHVPYLI